LEEQNEIEMFDTVYKCLVVLPLTAMQEYDWLNM